MVSIVCVSYSLVCVAFFKDYCSSKASFIGKSVRFSLEPNVRSLREVSLFESVSILY